MERCILEDGRTVDDGGGKPSPCSTAAERGAAVPVVSGPTRIVVNGLGFSIEGDRVSHELIAGLVLDGATDSCTVAFRHGPAEEGEGLLLPGRSVEIVDDEVFSVAVAVRS